MAARQKRLNAAWLVVLAVMMPLTPTLAAEATPDKETFLPITLKDWIVIASAIVSIFIAFRGVKNGLHFARKVIQAAARDMIKEMFTDPLARSAMRMMNWSGRTFTHGQQLIKLHGKDLKPALLVHQTGMGFNKQHAFIRDSFEAFFDHMLVLEHFIEQYYLNEADAAVPLEYYAGRIIVFPDTYDGFLQAYGYGKARDLTRRLAQRSKVGE
jgi:hypothetical protein